MDPARFQQSPTGKLTQVGYGEPPSWAFVPKPLPPELTFDAELVNALSEADRAVGELAGLGRTMRNPNLLIQPFMRREAVLSSRIEGTQTGIDELYAYEVQQLPMFGADSARRESDAREVLNYVRAMEYGVKRLNALPVSLRLIRELHERLMQGVRGERATPGEFRRSQNWIGSRDCALSEAAFVPPPVPEMHAALDDFEKYLHTQTTTPPLIRLALIHYQFEAIHPFLDGNGRIGRLLISLLLIDWKLLPLPLLYLSAYFERQRDSYYDLLLAVSERGAWHDWLLFFLRGVTDQSRDALERAKQLQNIQTRWHQQLAQARNSALLLRLADNLFERPILSIPDAQRTLDVTYRSARNAVQKLVEAGILTPRDGSTYAKTFLARDIFAAIAEKSSKQDL